MKKQSTSSTTGRSKIHKVMKERLGPAAGRGSPAEAGNSDRFKRGANIRRPDPKEEKDQGLEIPSAKCNQALPTEFQRRVSHSC